MSGITYIFSRLHRIRQENRAGRVTVGLGAVNAPYVRGASGSLAVDPFQYGALNSHEDQVQAALSRLQGWDQTRQRAASNLADMREAMSARRAEAQSHVAEIRSARREAQQALREARHASRLAQAAQIQGGGGSAAGVAQNGLVGRLSQRGFGLNRRGTLELGVVELGQGGFGLNRGGLRMLGGRMFTAALASRAVSGGINAIANGVESVNELSKKGASGSEMARTFGLGLAGAAREGVSELFGLDKLAASFARIFGMKPDDAEAAQRKFYDNLFTTREEQARRKQAQANALNEAYGAVDKALGDQLKAIQAYRPSTFRLRDRSELKLYVAEMHAANKDYLKALEEGLKFEEKRKIEARVADGG